MIGEAVFFFFFLRFDFLMLDLFPVMNTLQSSCSCLYSTDLVEAESLTVSPEDLAHINAYREISRTFM